MAEDTEKPTPFTDRFPLPLQIAFWLLGGVVAMTALFADGCDVLGRMTSDEPPAQVSATMINERLAWFAPTLRNAQNTYTPTLSELPYNQKLSPGTDITVPVPAGFINEDDLDRLAVVSVYQQAPKSKQLDVEVYPSSVFREQGVNWNWSVDSGRHIQSLFVIEASHAMDDDACQVLKTELEAALNGVPPQKDIQGRLYWASHIDPRPKHLHAAAPRLSTQIVSRNGQLATFKKVYLDKVYVDSETSFIEELQLAQGPTLADNTTHGTDEFHARGPKSQGKSTPAPHWIEAIHQSLSKQVLAFQGVSFEIETEKQDD